MHRWMLVLLFVGVLWMPSLFPPVSAFKVMDHAMCKGIDFKTLTCGEKTNGFLLTDEWAYFWFRATFEKSDDRAKAEIVFRDPDGLSFAAMTRSVTSQASPGATIMVADMVIWMGVEVNEGYAEGGFVLSPSSVNSEQVKQSSASIWGERAGAPLLPDGSYYLNVTFGPPPPRGYVVWVAKTEQPANTKVGEWQAEFTLNGMVVVSERFMIGETTTSAPPTTTSARPPTVTTPVATRTETQPSPLGLPSNLLLIVATAVVIVALVAAYMYVRRKKN